MKKRWMIILIAVSMVVFGSMAFAGDNVQDKATSQNSHAGAVMLANNSQTSPQLDDKALENFGVGEEEMGQGMLGDACETLCEIYRWSCQSHSPTTPPNPYCTQICNDCPGCEYCPKSS